MPHDPKAYNPDLDRAREPAPDFDDDDPRRPALAIMLNSGEMQFLYMYRESHIPELVSVISGLSENRRRKLLERLRSGSIFLD